MESADVGAEIALQVNKNGAVLYSTDDFVTNTTFRIFTSTTPAFICTSGDYFEMKFFTSGVSGCSLIGILEMQILG